MAGNQDKIQLPTNSTDISTLVRYLKKIKENEPLNNNTAQVVFQAVKTSGRRRKASGKRDTHTAGTLSTYGLIEYLPGKSKNFVVSDLGCELIEMYDDTGSPLVSEEKQTVMLLKVFSAWHETKKDRDIHPGLIILKLLCDKDLGYYITEHDIAFFTSNPDFKSDDQYDEIKKYILDFRNNHDGIFGQTKRPCKADIFMPTFVTNWHIFNKDIIYNVDRDPSNPGRFLFSEKDAVTDDIPEESDDTETGDTDVETVESTDAEMLSSGGQEDVSEEEEAEEDSTDDNGSNLGADITDENLYRTLTHYVLTKEAEIYCGVEFGYSFPVEQTVYFGAPGTGKSFKIDSRMKSEKVPDILMSRVIFYPDYTYGDFVGCLRPKKESGSSSVDYKFIPGPLTKALKTAFENPKSKIYFIIEEINRGSAAAVFGDLFQLLDREKAGRSKYSVKNEDMCTTFTESVLLKPFFEEGNVWFPSNFNILCTMNTADQNVFILDSAFKRRFHMEYIPIDFDALNRKGLDAYSQETDPFLGSRNLTDIFASTDLQAFADKLASAGKLKRNWPTFAMLVNATIDLINSNEGDQISEDKKLGPFYVLEDELESRTKFADKVLFYLKQDVFKYVDTYFSTSYQILYSKYVSEKMDVFQFLIPGGI